jgi:hypothetical protein
MNRSLKLLNICLIGVLFPSLLFAESGEGESSWSWNCRFTSVDLEGWTVQVDKQLVADGAHQETGEAALRVLSDKLRELTVLLPEEKLKRMQEMKIVMEYHNERLSSMQYHPSKQWLIENQHPEELHQAVHIPRASDLLGRLPIQHQPMVILHELSHAWHDQVLDFDHPEIMEVWEQFRKRTGDAECLHISGKMRQHYGMTNQKEFFAEMTESYFGCNDFYPFVRGELQRDYPEIFELLKKVWGKQAYP